LLVVSLEFLPKLDSARFIQVRITVRQLDGLGIRAHLGDFLQQPLGAKLPNGIPVHAFCFKRCRFPPSQFLNQISNPLTEALPQVFEVRFRLLHNIVQNRRAEHLRISDSTKVSQVGEHVDRVSDIRQGRLAIANLTTMGPRRECDCIIEIDVGHGINMHHEIQCAIFASSKVATQSSKIESMARLLAAADIGSNTAHLLVAATDGEIVMRIDNLNEWIPLGETVARAGQIPKEFADQLVGALKEFKKVSTAKGAERLYVFATEAMRSAGNHTTILKRIKAETGITVEVVSPEREAEFSFYGVRLDTREIKPDLMFEVGGGSAQIAAVNEKSILEDLSLPLGTGRLLAESGLTFPCPTENKKLAQEYIQRTLDTAQLATQVDGKAIASGGVARGLWRALHPDGEKRIAREEVEYLIWATERLSVERIIERFSVKPKRAGTLMAGAMVYEAIMRKFNLDEMMISEFGVREGAILEMAKNKIKGQAL